VAAVLPSRKEWAGSSRLPLEVAEEEEARLSRTGPDHPSRSPLEAAVVAAVLRSRKEWAGSSRLPLEVAEEDYRNRKQLGLRARPNGAGEGRSECETGSDPSGER